MADLLAAKGASVTAQILMKQQQVTPTFHKEAQSFAKQYGGLELRTSSTFHDRFLFVDGVDHYHLGASIAGAGR